MTNSMLNDMLLQIALIEDLGIPPHDVTTELLFPNSLQKQQARIVSKHTTPIVICGIELTRTLLTALSDNYHIHTVYQDGDYLPPDKTLLRIEAPASTLLKAERIVLNFLRHLSAIATLTAHYVALIKHTNLKILDTRKTTPGMRQLEKFAVQCGGGVNHRMGLYDAIMVKDTHIDMLGGIEHAIARLPYANRSNSRDLPVIIEVRSPQELAIVLEQKRQKITRVLLDNMPLTMLRECVVMCHGVVETEASGNIRLENIVAIAETGVNYASIGELTYNAGHVDLSMYTQQL